VTGGIGRALRVVALAYFLIGSVAAWGAFVLAPWGLLLLLFALAAVLVAFFLHLMSAGLAAIEDDDLQERATASELAESESRGRGDRR